MKDGYHSDEEYAEAERKLERLKKLNPDLSLHVAPKLGAPMPKRGPDQKRWTLVGIRVKDKTPTENTAEFFCDACRSLCWIGPESKPVLDKLQKGDRKICLPCMREETNIKLPGLV